MGQSQSVRVAGMHTEEEDEEEEEEEVGLDLPRRSSVTLFMSILIIVLIITSLIACD